MEMNLILVDFKCVRWTLETRSNGTSAVEIHDAYANYNYGELHLRSI